MRVVFLEDVPGVAHGGDVKMVRNGFARNYLLPKKLAVPATHNALQRIEQLAKQADVKRDKEISDMEALAERIEGMQISIPMRAGANGRLYGSVTNAVIAEALSGQLGREIDRRIVDVAEPIRELGNFDIPVRLHQEVRAEIKVLVYPAGTDPNAMLGSAEEAAETEAVEESTPVDEAAESEEDESSEEEPEDEEEE
ncbi:MAG: 50S ribosomal protein L9 [Chloroflexi bacterium]|nr:50S ribosomal protein L9 [Chloroflexota bacterium]